ncbi:hypothetical protein CC1G_15490 [Coprinopsis cinerea okayama7|uniref:Uncharacterized protein n=1 Tax=Coprinopsis cinerea (strain Okayama-7 / 130 / ATCC MYA-4618 / FGSC 9003) TaxID=240176 RepID=A8PGV4_COPC7|nr:hypothetical protein CC1G_15490 [Coprinopsis cinerea okayama7\|eukprot:XP_001841288.2 hypothetical protein CC1G_15490 [Coprinopsis cinerea okayama7\
MPGHWITDGRGAGSGKRQAPRPFYDHSCDDAQSDHSETPISLRRARSLVVPAKRRRVAVSERLTARKQNVDVALMERIHNRLAKDQKRSVDRVEEASLACALLWAYWASLEKDLKTKFGAKSVSETSLPVVKEQVEKLRGLLADLRSSVGKASAWIDLAQESAAALADDDDGLEYVDP